MRYLLLTAAALAFLATPALAQPDGQRRVPGQGHYDHPPAGAQPQAQPQPQPQPQRGGNGGPTSFTNQVPQGTLPNGQSMAPQGARVPGQGHYDRPPANAAQPQQQGRDSNRDRGRNDRGNWQGRDNRGYDNRGYGNRGYDNRGGYNRQRHDFSNFRDYHRNFHAQRRFRGPQYRRPAGWYDHRWTFGEFLPSAFWARDYWLYDYDTYDLPPPPYGAVWVRVGSDALLIDQDSGEVITVEYDVFY